MGGLLKYTVTMESQSNPVDVATPGLDMRRELLSAAIRRTSHDLGWQLSVVSPNAAPLDMVFLDETQVAMIIDQDGDGKPLLPLVVISWWLPQVESNMMSMCSGK